jgi:hypothetical protein
VSNGTFGEADNLVNLISKDTIVLHLLIPLVGPEKLIYMAIFKILRAFGV